MPKVFLDNRVFSDREDICIFDHSERETLVQSDDDLSEELEGIEQIFTLWPMKAPRAYRSR